MKKSDWIAAVLLGLLLAFKVFVSVEYSICLHAETLDALLVFLLAPVDFFVTLLYINFSYGKGFGNRIVFYLSLVIYLLYGVCCVIPFLTDYRLDGILYTLRSIIVDYVPMVFSAVLVVDFVAHTIKRVMTKQK